MRIVDKPKRKVDVPPDFNWDAALQPDDVGPLSVALVSEALADHGFNVRQPEDSTNTLLARLGAREIEVQVRGARKRSGPPFWPKHRFDPREGLYAAVVILDHGKRPALYLIPSLAWREPDALLRDLPNPRGESPPEWRCNISHKNDQLLAGHAFSKAVGRL